MGVGYMQLRPRAGLLPVHACSTCKPPALQTDPLISTTFAAHYCATLRCVLLAALQEEFVAETELPLEVMPLNEVRA
jgi:hypothetical protein